MPRSLLLAPLALLLALAVSPEATAQVCPGDGYYLVTQAQVDAFPDDCDTVEDGLFIENSTDITDLRPLAGLRSVEDEVTISNNAALASLEGLGGITSVGDVLEIENNASLTSLAGLGGITSAVDDLTIQGNASLMSLAGLDGISSVGYDLEIQNNASLTSLAGLGGLTFVGERLTIQDNAALASLVGLGGVTWIGDSGLTIRNNTALVSLEGLGSLTIIYSDLRVQNNAALTSLDGLDRLTRAWGGSIVDNASLSACAAGLAGLISGSPPTFYGFEDVPTIRDNASGGACNSRQEVLDAYLLLNAAPLADAGPDQTVVAGQTVTLDGTASTDPDGDALGFTWTLDGAPLSDTATPGFCATEAGAYTAELVVHDGAAASSPDAVTVTALTPIAALNALVDLTKTLEADSTLSRDDARTLRGRIKKARKRLVDAAEDRDNGEDPSGNVTRALNNLGLATGYLDEWLGDGTLSDDDYALLATPLAAVTGAVDAPCTNDPSKTGSAQASVGAGFGLAPPFPNPARGSATLGFELETATAVRLTVYDALGRQVAVLADGATDAGAHRATLDGSALPAGVYLVRLTTTDGQAATQRITVVR